MPPPAALTTGAGQAYQSHGRVDGFELMLRAIDVDHERVTVIFDRYGLVVRERAFIPRRRRAAHFALVRTHRAKKIATSGLS